MPYCWRALEHVRAEGPAVAAVVEGPIAARLLDGLDRGLVVQIQVSDPQGAGQLEVRIVGEADCTLVAPVVSRPGGAASFQARAFAAAAFASSPDRLVAEIEGHRQPARLLRVRVRPR